MSSLLPGAIFSLIVGWKLFSVFGLAPRSCSRRERFDCTLNLQSRQCMEHPPKSSHALPFLFDQPNLSKQDIEPLVEYYLFLTKRHFPFGTLPLYTQTVNQLAEEREVPRELVLHVVRLYALDRLRVDLQQE